MVEGRLGGVSVGEQEPAGGWQASEPNGKKSAIVLTAG